MAKVSPKAQVVVAVSVLIPVALSGVMLAMTPIWWVFTTYFWVAFPALGLLTKGLAGAFEAEPKSAIAEAKERELLDALREHGELTSVQVAMETSLSVAEADGMLGKLAEDGYLEVRARGGGIFYALWESAEPKPFEVSGVNKGEA